MNDALEIPEKMRMTWNRLVNRMPLKLRQRQKVLESVLLFLKLGGERLARQAIEAAKASLTLEETELRRQQKAETMRLAAERLAAENSEPDAGQDPPEPAPPDKEALL